MEIIGKDIYANIGMIFYKFATGQPYSVETLKQYRGILNGMQIQGMIESNTYEFYIDVIDSVLEFLKP